MYLVIGMVILWLLVGAVADWLCGVIFKKKIMKLTGITDDDELDRLFAQEELETLGYVVADTATGKDYFMDIAAWPMTLYAATKGYETMAKNLKNVKEILNNGNE